MFNILLILIFVGGIVIAAIFAGVTFLQGVRSAQEIQITKQRMLETAARIQSQARYVSGYIALPQGATGSAPYAYNQVPTWISSYARNAAGIPFVYCPYRSASNGGTASTVTMPSGATYAVNYTNNATTIAQNYVTAGSAAPAGAPAGTIGLLVAAAPQNNQPPDCSSVTASSDGTPVISGGYVVAIQDNFLNKMKVETAPTELRIYISGSASGDGTGRDTNNYATVTTALNMLNYVKPAQVSIIMGAGTFSFGNSLSWGGRVYLEGASAATTTISITSLTIDEFSLLSAKNVLLSDNGTLTVKGELQLDTANVTTTTLLSIQGGKMTSMGTSTITGNMTIDGGGVFATTAVAATTNISNLGNRGLKVINGGFYGDSGLTIILNPSTANTVPAYIGAGGKMETWGSLQVNPSAAVTLKGGFVIDPGGRFNNFSSTTLVHRVSDYIMYVHGGLELANGVIETQSISGGLAYGIILGSGGYIAESGHYASNILYAASSLNRASIGIYDNGGSRLLSNATTVGNIYSVSDCWHGRAGTNLFSDSASGLTNGQMAYTTYSATYKWLRLYNQAVWTCLK